MKFKYLTKESERVLYDEGISKSITPKGKVLITNWHETNWTKWNNYKYDQKVFESCKEWAGKGGLSYRITPKCQICRLINYIQKLYKKYKENKQ